MKNKLIIILGPTASGKTELSLEVAEAFSGEIISADSMQIYKGMDIGTAKLPEKERRNIPHHLIDTLDPDQNYSVAQFQTEAERLIDEINGRKHIPIIVGGTGLYISSLTNAYNFPHISIEDDDYQKEIRKQLSDTDNDSLYQKLFEIDQTAAKRIHHNDAKRIIRALEVYYQSGKTITELQKNNHPPLIERYNAVLIGLHMERSELYRLINQRVDLMIGNGLVNEVNNLINQGFNPDLNSMQGLGYKQIISYLYDEITLEEAVERIKRDTRHFAKRQLTWFKRDHSITWFDKSIYPGTKQLADAVIKYIRQVYEEEDYD